MRPPGLFPGANPLGYPSTMFAMPEWGGLVSVYPSGSPSQRWPGTATAIPPAGDYFVPGTKPAAQEHNWLWQQAMRAAHAALFWGGCVAATSWAAGISAPSDLSSNLQYEPVSGLWLLATRKHPTGARCRVFMLDGMGGVPFTVSGLPAASLQIGSDLTADYPTSMASDPVTGDVLVSNANASEIAYVQGSALTHAWISVMSYSATDAPIVAFQSSALGGTTYPFVWGASSGSSVLGNVTPIGGGSGGFNTGRVGGSGPFFSNFPAQGNGGVVLPFASPRWILRKTSIGAFVPQVLAVPNLARTPQVFLTEDGVTWTTISVATAWGASDVPIDLAFMQDNAGPGWLLAVQRGGVAAVVDFYRSTNGVVWTLQSTVHVPVVSLAAIGGLVVAATYDAPSGLTRMIFSADGGINFFETQLFNVGPTGFVVTDPGSPPPSVVASLNQFAVAIQSETGGVGGTRFSTPYGVSVPVT